MSKFKTGLPTRALGIDWETSGYLPPKELDGHFIGYADEHQGIALGAVVFDIQTFEPIDTFYVEIKFDDSKYKWEKQAEKIHGLSKEYLEENGLSAEDAATAFMNFFVKHFLPDEEVILLGHNKDFDIAFLHKFLEPFGIMPKLSYRGINTSDVGMVAFGMVKSDQIFEHIGLPPRQDHNALEDILYTLEVCKTVRTLVNTAMGGYNEVV